MTSPLTSDLLSLGEHPPVAEPSSWVKDLIAQRYQPKTERLKRSPVGFQFKRDPFDPSSYYKQLGQYRDISRAATGVVEQEAANRRASQDKARQEELMNALQGINPNYTYSDGDGFSPNTNYSHKYKLRGVSSNTAAAADYWGSRYGIKIIGGWRAHGSVPGSDHPKGRALDFMINNVSRGKARGTSLANDIISNYRQWNVKYVIWNRYIWSPGKGWRRYHGPSPHTDHVHVSFNK